MCGIAGWVDMSGRTTTNIAIEMARLLRHRGPDAQEFSRIGPACLVHTRLSILDLARSNQPMRSGTNSITFNGEIYNFREIRADLRAPTGGWRTDGDTEVLVELVAQDGVSALNRVEGMFAFGLWDEAATSLILARDRFGKKPLYFATPREDLIVFASEPKAVLAHPEVESELNADSLRQVSLFRACYGEESLYRVIRAVRPGDTIGWNPRSLSNKRYFEPLSLLAPRIVKSPNSLEATLRQAVRARLVSDVPVGAFLSGGIDSSLVVALMRDELGPLSPLRTYSVSFEDDPHDENPWASLVADRFGTEHVRVTVGGEDFVRDMARLSAIRDAPLSEPADVAIAVMSRRARQDVKVVLSGEGADEAFGGYPKYLLSRAPSIIRLLVRHCSPPLLRFFASQFGLDSRRAEIAARSLSAQNEIDRIAQWFAVADESLLRSLFPRLWGTTNADCYCAHREALKEMSGIVSSPMLRMQYVDLLTWLPGNLLERGDRMTMSAGLEARMPFMSPAVIGEGFSMSPREKVSLRYTKAPLRRLCAQLVGSDVAYRPKWGFRVPLDRWFRGCLLAPLQNAINADGSFVQEYGDVTVARSLIEDHAASRADHQSLLWTMLVIEKWYAGRIIKG